MDKARRGLHPVAERHVGSEGQGQSLAVLEGTTTPYSYKTMAEPGPIKGPDAKKLTAARNHGRTAVPNEKSVPPGSRRALGRRAGEYLK